MQKWCLGTNLGEIESKSVSGIFEMLFGMFLVILLYEAPFSAVLI